MALQYLPGEWGVLLEITLCCALLIVVSHIWGKEGIGLYVVLAMLVCNIQILRVTHLTGFHHPIALGSVTYGSLSMALAIMTERYGQKSAKSCIMQGIVAMCGFTAFMFVTLWYVPPDPTALPEHLRYMHIYYEAMQILFEPTPGILFASLVSYYASSRLEVALLVLSRCMTARYTALRIIVSSNIAILCDLCMMNTILWVWFLGKTLTLYDLLVSYVLSAYLLRLVMSCCTYPVMRVTDTGVLSSWRGAERRDTMLRILKAVFFLGRRMR